jgi:hypothetical protein
MPPFRWRSLLAIAVNLVTPAAAGEPQFRSAVNRRYYAVLGEARVYVEGHGYRYVRGRGGSHEQIWNYLRNQLPAHPIYVRAAGRAIAAGGVRLRDMRVESDYQDGTPVQRSDAEAAIALAQQLVTRLLRLP